ncbi:GHMP family kinase ATP-binding protein [Roseicella aerolata]|uniref:Kinase n=1 Tax=Roseicella aerolata TaxID=2883479 RepID=A0A9X1IIX0_9PROT|nr:kinase [Roseicella aerolata]MCB4825480.1 kinase [Roseicella aerolata]
MIISRTPLRMSFVGGGSDLPAFYRRYGGAVVSTAIDKYVYVNINKKFDGGTRIAYSRTEEVDSIEKIEHRLVRATFEMLKVKGGVEITTIADIPSRGTGLGSSSSFTVGLINALSAYLGRYVSAEELGARSCEVEIERCGEPIGKQDQYAAAYGGFNLIQFNPDDSVAVTPVIMPKEKRAELERNIIVFYTGITRSASAILQTQSDAIVSDAIKQEAQRRMVQLAFDLMGELQRGNLNSFGEILDENWQLKKSLAPGVSTGDIDGWYEAATAAGAIGGKILGAGSGGFLMFYAPQEQHEVIERALAPLRKVKFGFDPLGSRIIFYNPSN